MFLKDKFASVLLLLSDRAIRVHADVVFSFSSVIKLGCDFKEKHEITTAIGDLPVYPAFAVMSFIENPEAPVKVSEHEKPQHIYKIAGINDFVVYFIVYLMYNHRAGQWNINFKLWQDTIAALHSLGMLSLIHPAVNINVSDLERKHYSTMLHMSTIFNAVDIAVKGALTFGRVTPEDVADISTDELFQLIRQMRLKISNVQGFRDRETATKFVVTISSLVCAGVMSRKTEAEAGKLILSPIHYLDYVREDLEMMAGPDSPARSSWKICIKVMILDKPICAMIKETFPESKKKKRRAND